MTTQTLPTTELGYIQAGLAGLLAADDVTLEDRAELEKVEAALAETTDLDEVIRRAPEGFDLVRYGARHYMLGTGELPPDYPPAHFSEIEYALTTRVMSYRRP